MTDLARQAYDATLAHGDGDSLRIDLDDAALYGVLGDIVRAIREDTEACDAALYATFAAATGSAIGAGPYYVVESDRHTVALNIVLVGASARGRKGTAGGRVTAVMDVADHGWACAAPFNGFGSGEGFVAELADPDRHDERLYVDEREFARLLTVASRDGSTLSPHIRNAFDRQPLRLRTRKERRDVTSYHVSSVGHITLEELRRRLDATELTNGFANRFLWVMTHRARVLPDGGTGFGQHEIEHWGTVLGERIAAARPLGRMRRTADGTARWAELYLQIAETELPGLVGAITNRAEAYLLRLSMLFALLDGTSEIDVPHIDAAWALCQHSERTARLVWSDLTGDVDLDRLLAAVRRAGPEGLSIEAITVSVFARNRAASPIVERALRYGLVRTVSVETEGRPRTMVVAL